MIAADVGAGTGFITAGIALLVKRVYLIDGSEKMLDVARENLKDFKNLEFHHADGQKIPLPDESLDVVFANMYLHHCPDPAAAIYEMVRVLRPAGRLVITDLDSHTNEWLREQMADVWLGFDRDRMREWFTGANLVNVIVDCTGQTCHAENVGAGDDKANISIFIATGTKRVTAQASVRNNYSDRATNQGCGCSDSCCCSQDDSAEANNTDVSWITNYSPEEQKDIPTEALEISLGCGNPIAMAELNTGETVLDIGSGGGIDVFLAARRVGKTGFVYGIDMTPAMLDRARKTAEKNGISNVEFRQGYAEDLPVEDNSIDVIISNCVINLTEDKGKVFKEAYRVLKNGGRLEVNDVVFDGPILPEMRASVEGWSECVSGALPESEYIDLVKQAGFKNVSVRRSTSSGIASGVSIYSIQVSARK
jgi:ubiquinone/menaquinone biosynthesis C-methylase UbiE